MEQEEKNKDDKKKGIIITAISHAVLLVIFIFFGLGYEEPKPRVGYVVNFGDSELGFGNQQNEPQSASSTTTQQPVSQDKVETTETNDQSVQTQDVTDAASVNNQASKQVDSNNQDKPDEVEDPKPSDNLSKLLQNVKNSKNSSDGNDNVAADKGNVKGDVNSNNYDGDNSDGGGTGNYRLGNRKAIEKPTITYEPCKDEGRVVVRIKVNRQGRVISTEAGVKIPNGPSSTTTSGCLFKKAESAAKRTVWQADLSAKEFQPGYIIYNFYKS